ncbi:hypothetical protein SAMN05444817_1128 [Corynebacterium appendicis CIP 107643]|uniref:Uncharacterized protein n=1 Tax=Corynebacterium appendicis CIP 107643 TaxID=1161099 RepID=A0A1N7JX91_9CORY|nr:hypothetical protein [Corynebacterium appendicis]WJY60592.1 hypothetical protein CAPP_03300 [Corynebacterium appendicis CIP 107643]SIS53937.1 hypothetical protein SAMN05444817_1128 [Corynebacterium appendicis CIP 107643]
MRFDTYELYYLDTYDEEAVDLADDLGIGHSHHGSTRACTTAPRLKSKPNFGDTTPIKK